jgi:aconitate hydratase
MGVLPLVFEQEGQSWQSLGLKGDETVAIRGLSDLKPRAKLTAEVKTSDGRVLEVPLLCRIDTLDELEYYRHGGILHYVLRNLAAA